jgi:hypothetical protein
MSQEEKESELNKAHELYKASLSAFFTNELEADKTILGLSVAAIGFFMALFLNKELQITELMFITIVLAQISFIITSAIILMIFTYNKKLILHIIETTGAAEKEPELLALLDKWKYIPFVMGILFSIIFTLSLMFEKVNAKDDKNSTECKVQNKPVCENIGEIAVYSEGNSKNTAESVSKVHPQKDYTDTHIYKKSSIGEAKKYSHASNETQLSNECRCIIKFDNKGENNESK